MRFSDIAGKNGMFLDGDWIEKKDQDPNGKVRLIQLADIGAGEFKDKSNRFLTEEKASELHCTMLKKGDLLIARLGEPLCKACIFPLDGLYITAVDIAILRIGCEQANPKYLVYLINSPWFKDQVKRFESGTTRKRISRNNLDRIEIELPPIPDQERIVARIEEMFSQLDAGVETLKKTKAQLAVYRQAVLKEAFTNIPNVTRVKVSQLCNVVRGGSPRPAGDERYYNGNIPFLKVADLTRNGEMYLSNYTYTIKEAGLQKTRMVPANTLLLTNSGATLGVPKVCTFETTMNDGIAAFLDFDLEKEYLPYHYYYWLSKTTELRAINQGAAQPNLNTSIIGQYGFPHCSYELQKAISQRIESRLSVCDSIEQTVDAAMQQAEAMRQSILKQAFGGSL